jgi:hypothetical protein
MSLEKYIRERKRAEEAILDETLDEEVGKIWESDPSLKRVLLKVSRGEITPIVQLLKPKEAKRSEIVKKNGLNQPFSERLKTLPRGPIFGEWDV